MLKPVSKAAFVLIPLLWVLAACNPDIQSTPTVYSTDSNPAETTVNVPVAATLPGVEIPTEIVTNIYSEMYEPVDTSVCQLIQGLAAEALNVNFQLEENAPFLDEVANESGAGCRLTAAGDGNTFTDPQVVLSTLTQSAGLGWTEQIDYQADGPTGSSTGLVRDMALMLIKVNWSPAEDTACSEDQPISACNITPEQQLYTIEIDIAQYKATFSLDGQWVDTTTGLSLYLGQEWKNIYGGHTIVAQNGNKIDSLETSITGKVSGNGADIEFGSSFTGSTGTARIEVIDPNTITWTIVTPPEGEYYLPETATLVRN